VYIDPAGVQRAPDDKSMLLLAAGFPHYQKFVANFADAKAGRRSDAGSFPQQPGGFTYLSHWGDYVAAEPGPADSVATGDRRTDILQVDGLAAKELDWQGFRRLRQLEGAAAEDAAGDRFGCACKPRIEIDKAVAPGAAKFQKHRCGEIRALAKVAAVTAFGSRAAIRRRGPMPRVSA